jgi:hypothetical protein
MSVSVTLKQEKTVLPDKFRVVSWITSAEPDEMYPLFVLESGLDPWEETYNSVADLDDLARYAENPLTRFADPIFGSFSGLAVTGDLLVITNHRNEWESSFLPWQVGFYSGFVFPVDMSTVPGGAVYLVIDYAAPSWQAFPDARDGLTWVLLDSTGGFKHGGSNGYSRARNDASGKFLRRHLTMLYPIAAAAEAHALSVDAGVHSVATAASTTPPPFGGLEEHIYP